MHNLKKTFIILDRNSFFFFIYIYFVAAHAKLRVFPIKRWFDILQEINRICIYTCNNVFSYYTNMPKEQSCMHIFCNNSKHLKERKEK